MISGNQLTRTYSPALAIVVYNSPAGEFYLESHSISKEGAILEGKPLLQETIQDIVEVFYRNKTEQSIITGFFPEALLKFEPTGKKYEMIWYRPSCIKRLHFTEDLGIPAGDASVPALLYKVDKNDKLFVFALDSDKRPDYNTKLFRAPFHNLYKDGSVCLGNARVKRPAERTFSAEIQMWETLFWNSKFSHLNGSENPAKTNINILWKQLIKSGSQWDASELLPINRTVKNILK